MKEKVRIKIGHMKSEHDIGLIYSVEFFARTYGSASPCRSEREVRSAVKHCFDWIRKEGDIPVVEDLRVIQIPLFTSDEPTCFQSVKGGNEKMKVLRIKIDPEKAKPTKNGYYTAYFNENKGDNRNAPDFKSNGVGVWENELESLETAENAVEAGAAGPKVVRTLQA